MLTPLQDIDWGQKIFNSNIDFNSLMFEIYHHQLKKNEVYKQWVLSLGKHESLSVNEIPFLPISLFKNHNVKTGDFEEQAFFESSGTTQTISSRHFVKDISIYKKSFINAFENIYGSINQYCILGLLPSYIERGNSSLVFMVNEMMQLSKHSKSNFYLANFHELNSTLQELEAAKQKTLLIGVTYALLDFANAYPQHLQYTIIMETGGMKGRKQEMLRNEVHDTLKKQFKVSNIHSEYGMTELLSQAYAKENGRFFCPAWMKAFVRDEDDPLLIKASGTGLLNIIDLANVHSCSFIATDDVATIYHDGSFEILGRQDNSDLRGCSLLYL